MPYCKRHVHRVYFSIIIASSSNNLSSTSVVVLCLLLVAVTAAPSLLEIGHDVVFDVLGCFVSSSELVSLNTLTSKSSLRLDVLAPCTRLTRLNFYLLLLTFSSSALKSRSISSSRSSFTDSSVPIKYNVYFMSSPSNCNLCKNAFNAAVYMTLLVRQYYTYRYSLAIVLPRSEDY